MTREMASVGDNSLSGAEALVQLLDAFGVRHIFGLCGDTSLPFYDAMHRLDHDITHVLTRDERHATYMADAYARVSKRVGVCEGPSGGGATYILPGLVEANDSSIPVLAITTDVSVAALGHYPLTELAQNELFRPLTKWNGVVDRAERLPSMLRAAFRAMTTGRPGAAHLGLPYDVQNAQVSADDIWVQAEFGRYPAWRSGPDPKSVEAAVERLLSAKRPVAICGGGVVLSAGEAALKGLAERLNLVVATTISGQGALSDTHANCLGVVGSNGGTPATRAAVEDADLIVFIGCRAGSVTTERWQIPSNGVPVIHIDSDPMVISANYRTEVALVSDARLALEALNAAIDANGSCKVDFSGRERVASAKKQKFAAFEKLAVSGERPIRPERVVRDLHRVLPDDAIIVADPGTPCPYFSAFYDVPMPGRHFISNRAHGALGYSLPAAIGAQLAQPDAKVVSVMGDGSFGFSVGEFETVARLKLPITFVVFSNSSYGWIKAGQKTGFEQRYFSVDFNATDHAAVASAYGIKSWRVEDPEQLESVLAKAAEHGEPTLVDVISQPLQEAQAPVSEWVA
jgi:acetolactate synthase-1/2/3 large subunit